MGATRGRRATSLGLTLCLLAAGIAGVVAFSDVARATGPGGMAGAGTAGDPYVVTNVTQLQASNQSLGSYYVLGNDIDASDTATWNGGEGLQPIGTDGARFTGTLDGNYHAISDLTVDNSSKRNVGLFGVIGSAGTVEQVDLTAVAITGDTNVGGLVGFNHGTIRNASVSGDVSAVTQIGGLVGSNGGTVSDSSSTATATATHSNVGGLIGLNTRGVVESSWANGTVTGGDRAGGLVGYNYGGGSTAVIRRSLSTGSVSGGSSVGGLLGHAFDGGTTVDSYWDTDASGQATSAGSATGLSTANMTGSAAETNLTALDFVDTWTTTAGYPTLQWDAEPASFDVTIDDTNTPINASETLAVNVTVTNTGDATATRSLNLTDLGGTERDRIGVTLPGGATNRSFTLHWRTQPGDGGSVTVAVSSPTDTDNASVTVNSLGNFSVTIEGTNAPIAAGDPLTVDVNVTNVGETPATMPVNLSDFDGGEQDSVPVTLAAGASNDSIRLTWGTTTAEAGNGPVTVASPNGSDSASVALNDETAPTVDAGPNQTIDEDTQTSFDGSNSTDTIGVVTYNWTFGDGSNATGATPSHRYADPGTYTVTLNASDAAGNHGSDALTVTVRRVSSGGGSGGAGGGGGGGGSVTGDQRITVVPLPIDDSNPATVDRSSKITIDNVRANTRLSIDVRPGLRSAGGAGGDRADTAGAGNDAAIRDGGDVRMDRVELTVERGGDYELDVETSGVRLRPVAGGQRTESAGVDLSLDALPDAGRQFAGETGRRPAGFIRVDHPFPNRDVSDVALRFEVRKSYLAEIGVDPAAVRLYRDEPGGWRALSTRQVGETTEYYRFVGNSPGLSVFTIGTDAPVFAIENVRADGSDETVHVGEAARVRVTVDNVGGANGQFVGIVTANGDPLDRGSVSVPTGGSRTLELGGVLQDPGTYQLAVNGRPIGSVEVRQVATVGGEHEREPAAPDSGDDSSRPVWTMLWITVVLGILTAAVFVYQRRLSV